jgi:agmatine/peptidylarginine deiminase
MTTREPTTRSLVYSMPAEWDPHGGTWLQWPQNKFYSRDELKLERTRLDMLDALNEHENVHLVCKVDLGRIERVRNISSYPFHDRRVDSYQDLTKQYSS